MKNKTMFDYNFLFSDHFSKTSNQARLYYICLNFYADRGFVANPLGVLDSLGYDKSVFWELVKNEEILVLPDRCEIFITSYYVHNNKFNHLEWLKSPFAIYWKGKLYIKKNGVAKFNPNGIEQEEHEPLDNIIPPEEESADWDEMMQELDNLKKEKENNV